MGLFSSIICNRNLGGFMLSHEESEMVREVKIRYRAAIAKARGKRVDYRAIVRAVAEQFGYTGNELARGMGIITNAHNKERRGRDGTLGFSRSI